MSALNIESFNEILLAAAKDDQSKVKILEAELATVGDLFLEEVGVLLDELQTTGYNSPQFQTILNIKANTEKLFATYEKLKKEVEK